MTIFFTILMMAIIGAIIGGLTNSIAIKMLFRPYKPIYIGKVRLPFTPGLIPKRHKDVAYQLGRMVVNHLLTPEGISKKLQSNEFKQPIIQFFQNEGKKLLHSKITVKQLMVRVTKREKIEEQLKNKIAQYIGKAYCEKMNELNKKTIAQVLPQKTKERGEQYIETIATHIVNSSASFFSSEEGKERLQVMVEQFFESRGGMLGMIMKFMDPESLTIKVQREIIQLLHQDDTKQIIVRLLEKEYNQLLEKEVITIEESIGREKIITFLKNQLVAQLPIEKWMNKTIEEVCKPYEQTIVQNYIPTFTEKAIVQISERLPDILEHLHLADVVRDEVLSFPLERLEGMILEISRREFKMITYLGALLGGLIGVIQGIIALFI